MELLRISTYDDSEWQLVPKQLTPHMAHTADAVLDDAGSIQWMWDEMLQSAPEPPNHRIINFEGEDIGLDTLG